jgi:membrane protein implicated in regulation of membrane protease activity
MDMGTVYLIMVGGATLFLLIMLLTGLGHHDVSSAGHDIGHGLHVGGHGHDFDMHGIELQAGEIPGDGPGMLGLRLILAFIIGFGVGGYIGWYYNIPYVPHWALGLVGGIVTYTIVYQLLKMLFRLQANTLVNSQRMINTDGVVTSEIMPDSVGEIKVTDPKTGQTHYMRAMSVSTGTCLKKGQKVTVVSVTGGLAKVQ